MSSKITALTALTSAQPDDVLPVVDVHDTSMAASGTTKQITVANLTAGSLPLAGGTMSGAIAMGSHKITGLTNGSGAQDAAAFGQVMAMVATTGISGFALQNATPNIFTWTAPNDGQMHRMTLLGELVVASTETGGIISLTLTDPGNTSRVRQIFAGGSGAGLTPIPGGQSYTVAPATTVTLAQTSALTGGAATLWAEMWGS